MTETTIFPARQGGKVHAAFLMDEATDAWATRCGQTIKDPLVVKLTHATMEVECKACIEQIQRGRNLKTLK